MWIGVKAAGPGAGRGGHAQSVSKQWAHAAGREGSTGETSVLKRSSYSEHMRPITALVALGGFGCTGDVSQMHRSAVLLTGPCGLCSNVVPCVPVPFDVW